MTHEEMPTGPQYDLPISVVEEYSIPPISSGLGGTSEPKMHATTKMADQNYRSREYHEFVREMAELHRPIVKINTIMPCPTCDRSWYVRASPDAKVCQFWTRAVKFGLVKDNPLEPPILTTATATAITTPLVHASERTFAVNTTDEVKVVEHGGAYIQYHSIGD